jgi:hypothetical protein
MENLKLIIEAIEKGVGMKIYSNLELRAIQSTIEELAKELAPKEEPVKEELVKGSK